MITTISTHIKENDQVKLSNSEEFDWDGEIIIKLGDVRIFIENQKARELAEMILKATEGKG